MGVYNQQTIKEINKKQIYRLINETPGISRVKIAFEKKLSKTTVSALVDELIQENYVLDKGMMESKRQGRKPNSLTVNSKENCIVIVNWRKRSLGIALVTSAFTIDFCKEVILQDSKGYASQIQRLLQEFIEENCIGKHILGISIIVPGMIESREQKIISMVLSLDQQEDIIKELREKIKDYPLSVVNDTACFAYAENAYGEIKEKNYVYLNINEGVGATLIHEGNLLRGATGMGTQFGHFSVDRKGESCVCGNKGCLENRIGELALAKRAKECNVWDIFGNRDHILFKEIGELVAEGNEKAILLLDALVEDLSFGLGNLITMFHPEKIIIGGMGRKLGELFLEKLKIRIKEVGFIQFVSDVEIEFTKLGEGAVLQGAAKYYMDTHYGFSEDMSNKMFLY